jgi:hypothetical protein
MNGIHEVTGSIPVWSTILRSRLPTSVSYGWQATRRLSTEAPKERRRTDKPRLRPQPQLSFFDCNAG